MNRSAMQAEGVASAKNTEWLKSTEIARRLRISRNRLPELIEKGVLQPGRHFIQHGKHRTWDAQATEEALRDMARQRHEAQPGETYQHNDYT